MNEHMPRLVIEVATHRVSAQSNVRRVCEALVRELSESQRFNIKLVSPDERADGAPVRPPGTYGGLTVGPIQPPSEGEMFLTFEPRVPHGWCANASVLLARVVCEPLDNRPEIGFGEGVGGSGLGSEWSGFDMRSSILVFSEASKEEVLRSQPELNPAQIVLVPPATDSARCEDPGKITQTLERYGVPAGVPFVLCDTEGLTGDELRQLANAVRALQGVHGDLHFLFLKSALDGLGDAARGRIVCTKEVSANDWSPLLSGAVCFAHLSQRDRVGLSILDAMACGTPVVCAASTVSSLAARVGVVVDRNDFSGLVREALGLHADPEARRGPCAQGSEQAAKFNWKRSCARLVDALADADRRFKARPVSMLWQYPGEHPRNPAALASFIGFHNGARGPVFGSNAPALQSSWPEWRDDLPHHGATPRVEGGARTRGLLKSGSADLPLVSFVTVVRNNASTLERAIESVKRQTYENVEHIVLDGASTDGTIDLIVRHADTLDYYVAEPDRGLYDAINKAVPLARGDLICILNSDDWLEPHAAEIAVRRMQGQIGKPALLATGAVVYSLEGKVEVEWPPMFVHPGSYFACPNICHNGVYATRAAYERSGPYDATFRIAADSKWVMACLDAGVEFSYTREVTVSYSLGGTSGDAKGHSLECQRIVAERFPFLEADEVKRLYDCYFLFAHQPHDPPIGSVEAPTTFLRRMFAESVDQPAFEAAMSWAAMTKLEHPADRQAVVAAAPASQVHIPSIRRSAKDLVKGVLHRYPTLYWAAMRSYASLRRW